MRAPPPPRSSSSSSTDGNGESNNEADSEPPPPPPPVDPAVVMDKLLAGKAGKMAVEELAEVLLKGLEEGEGRLVKRARVHEVVLANLQVH